MNVRGIISGAIQVVNANRAAQLLLSTGATIGRAGKPVPTYVRVDGMNVRVQPLGSKELAHMDSLNIAGTLRAVYLSGAIDTVERVNGKGGDLVEFADPILGGAVGVWLVVNVDEVWPGWCHCVVQLQKDVAGTIAPVEDLAP